MQCSMHNETPRCKLKRFILLYSAYVIESECFTGFYEANKALGFFSPLNFLLNSHRGIVLTMLPSHIKDRIVLSGYISY